MNLAEYPVTTPNAHARAVAEFCRDGYDVVEKRRRKTILKYERGASFWAHLLLFMVIGWATLGLLNLWYEQRKRKASRERVTVVTREAGEKPDLGEFGSHETVRHA